MKHSLLLWALLPFYLLAQYQPQGGHDIIEHQFYTLSYNETHEQADWVYYKLDHNMLEGGTERADNFRADPKVKTGSATLEDYSGSGYDRGHLAPAADMTVTQAMSESFYMTNMSPQTPSFNRGAWKSLEATVRYWASETPIYVVTGPIFTDNKGSIGPNAVTIPGYYYKVIYEPNDNKMIAFVMPNDKISADISSFVVSTDEVERMTGIDFFHQLDDALEDRLESSTTVSDFEFKSYTKQKTTTATNSGSQTCKGVSKSSGNHCKNKTKNPNGFCHHHQPA